MGESIRSKYRNYQIDCDGDTGDWHCYELKLTADKLPDLRRQIDAALKKDRKFVQFKAYQTVGYRDNDDFRIVTVTSITEDGESAWIAWDSGKRKHRERTRSLDDMYPVSPASDKAIKQVNEIREQIKKLEERRQEILAELETVEDKALELENERLAKHAGQ